MKRILAFLIAILLLSTVLLTSCSKGDQGGEEDTSVNTVPTEQSYKEELGFDKGSYGKTFRILLNNTYPIFERDFYAEALDGNNISSVVYERNAACEQYLGIDIEYMLEAGDWKSGITDKVIPDEVIAFGEIGLSGEVRAVSHIEYRVKEAIRLGFTKIILPKKNMSKSLTAPKNVELCGVSNIYEVLIHMKPKERENFE